MGYGCYVRHCHHCCGPVPSRSALAECSLFSTLIWCHLWASFGSNWRPLFVVPNSSEWTFDSASSVALWLTWFYFLSDFMVNLIQSAVLVYWCFLFCFSFTRLGFYSKFPQIEVGVWFLLNILPWEIPPIHPCYPQRSPIHHFRGLSGQQQEIRSWESPIPLKQRPFCFTFLHF